MIKEIKEEMETIMKEQDTDKKNGWVYKGTKWNL